MVPSVPRPHPSCVLQAFGGGRDRFFGGMAVLPRAREALAWSLLSLLFRNVLSEPVEAGVSPSACGLGRPEVIQATEGNIQVGSLEGQHDPNLYCQWLIQTDQVYSSGRNDTVLMLRFEWFATEACCDYLVVYDAPLPADPLAVFSGNIDVDSTLIVSPTGTFLLEFRSDDRLQESGFRAHFMVGSPPKRPILLKSSTELSQTLVDYSAKVFATQVEPDVVDNLETLGEEINTDILIVLDSSNYTTNVLPFLEEIRRIDGSVLLQDIRLPTPLNLGFFQKLESISDSLAIVESNTASLEGLEGVTRLGGSLYLYNNKLFGDLQGLSGIASINGSIFVAGNQRLSSLQGLEKVTAIEGDLVLLNNPRLTSLQGLQSLQRIGGNLQIELNSGLSTLDGLKSLSSVGGSVIIRSNVGLGSLQGLKTLFDVGGDILVEDNPALLTMNGLANVTHIKGTLRINANRGLTSLIGLRVTTIEGELDIWENDALSSLVGLETINTTLSDVVVDNNDQLQSLQGLDNLIQVGGSLLLRFNEALLDLHGLERLREVNGSLLIWQNGALGSISALSNLENVGGDLTIEDTSALLNLYGLENLSKIGGNFNLQNNDGIISFNGLQKLKYVGGDLDVADNSALSSFLGLDNLERVDGTILIRMNHKLVSLQGLDKLNAIGKSLFIESNNGLSTLSGLSYLEAVPDTFYVSANAGLQSLTGMMLKEVKDVVITNNNVLESLEGLESLLKVFGNLEIMQNSRLGSLLGLKELVVVGGNFSLAMNGQLQTLDGLDKLSEIGGNLVIRGNYLLNDSESVTRAPFRSPVTSVRGQKIDLSQNSFYGDIPVDFLVASKPTEINLSNNRYEGTLDPGLCAMEGLQFLDVSQNHLLCGEIPEKCIAVLNYEFTSLGFPCN